MSQPRRMALLGITAVAAIVGALVLTLALQRGGEDRTPSAAELERIADEINEQLRGVSNVGLGEGSPPRDEVRWQTDFSRRSVPLDELESGGPQKDGIPAVDEPRYLRVDDVDFLGDREPVVAVSANGVTHAYPIQILIWHEIVNARLGDVPVAVTFCPLCNTAIAFDRRLGGRALDFGTTGKLRSSDLVMYDRQTESWWQQFGGEAIVGELTGAKLDQLPARIVSWEEFRRRHPEGLVLSRETGYVREYGANPYPGYDRIDSPPLFAARNPDDERLAPKERVVYVEVGRDAFAVPLSSLRKRRTIEIVTDAGSLRIRSGPGVASPLDDVTVASGRDVGTSRVELDGEPVPFHEPFWFAVAAFRPDVKIVP